MLRQIRRWWRKRKQLRGLEALRAQMPADCNYILDNLPTAEGGHTHVMMVRDKDYFVPIPGANFRLLHPKVRQDIIAELRTLGFEVKYAEEVVKGGDHLPVPDGRETHYTNWNRT